jgi:hypothetical protein
MKTMKVLFLTSTASFVCALAIFAQSPSPADVSPSPVAQISPTASVPASPATTVSPAPTASASATNEFAEKIKQKAERKVKKGLHIEINGDEGDRHIGSDEDFPEALVPVIVISMLAVFGMPVAIVAVIMLISWAKTRSLHRTVRTMVEKGQPVPPELLASPAGAPLRPWYDLRRGIVLLAVGVGVVMFFGISAGWDEGVWALGLIPALIGGGYILAWRLAQKQQNGFKV